MGVAALVGGLLVAACFALFSGGARPDARGRLELSPTVASRSGEDGQEAAAKLRRLATAASLSPREERAVAAALREARASGTAALAYFEGLKDDVNGACALDPEHAAEVETIVEAVITARLAVELDRGRVQALERQLRPVVDWLALGGPGAGIR
jgi:hypothetical protein